MRVLLPLAVMALAACDPPLEELYPSRFYTFSHATVPYEMRAQWDPFERGWFIRVTSLTYPLTLQTEPAVLSAIQQGLAPELCEGRALAIKQGDVWNPFAVKEVLLLPNLGAFQFVGRCSDVPVLPAETAIFAPSGALINIHDVDSLTVGPPGAPNAVVLPDAPASAVIVVPGKGWGF